MPDGLFHVATLGVDRTPIYRDGVDRRSFLSLLTDSIERYGWELYAYCLMTTHYHLVLRTGGADLARGMQRPHRHHTARLNRPHGPRRHLFVDRHSTSG